MDTIHENHPTHFFILFLIVIAIGILGYTSLKNVNNTTSSIVYITPTLSPTKSPTPKPTTQHISTDEAGITLQETQQLKPAPPSDLTIIQVPEGLQLQWRALRGDITSYTIYRTEGTGKPQKINSKTAQKETELQTNGQYDFIDLTVQNKITYTYSVSATNIFGKESDPSESVSVKYETLTVE